MRPRADELAASVATTLTSIRRLPSLLDIVRLHRQVTSSGYIVRLHCQDTLSRTPERRHGASRSRSLCNLARMRGVRLNTSGEFMLRLMVLALAAVVGCLTPAAAQYPERPITMIVPFAAGGPTDIIARIVGEDMQKTLGQPIIVENVAGAGGTTGITRGAQAKPDGYTIMMGHMGTHAAAPALYPNLKYDPTKDFAPIGLTAGTPILIIAKKTFPAANLQDFVDHLRKNQDKVNEAHAGVGSVSFTTCTMLQSLLGTKTARVAYRGTAPSLNDLVAGQVDFGCDQIVNVVSQVQAGSI